MTYVEVFAANVGVDAQVTCILADQRHLFKNLDEATAVGLGGDDIRSPPTKIRELINQVLGSHSRNVVNT